MESFDWEKNRKATKEWEELYDSLKKEIGDNSFDIDAPLYTMIQIEPHKFVKCRLKSIKHVKDWFAGEHFILTADNENNVIYNIGVYPAFEIKSGGKIHDIVMIFLFIKDQIKQSKKNISVETETVIV